MSDFYYCHGICLDANFMEHTCKKRENCKYYVEDFFRKYGAYMDRFDFLVCEEECKYYIPKREDVKRELGDEDPFNIHQKR